MQFLSVLFELSKDYNLFDLWRMEYQSNVYHLQLLLQKYINETHINIYDIIPNKHNIIILKNINVFIIFQTQKLV